MKYKVSENVGRCRRGCRAIDDCDNSCNQDVWASQNRQLAGLSNSFHRECKRKLLLKAAQGRSGWDNDGWTIEDIKKTLIEHIEKGDPVDVANFAAFWWNRI